MKRFLALLTTAVCLISCQKEEFDPSESFTKIYDSFRSDLAFYPVDVVATETGFLILSGETTDQSSFRTIRVVQLDEEGNYVKHLEETGYVIPVGDFVGIDSVYYFFAMDETTLRSTLMSTDANLTDITATELVDAKYYPLAAARTSDGNLLLTNYNLDQQNTEISEIAIDGATVREAAYSIGPGSEVEPFILNHYLDPERSGLPFFCGEIASGQVYFNGFVNYSLSLAFSNFGGSLSGVVQGQEGANGGITHAKPTQNSNFAVLGFQFNDNFIVPSTPLTGTSSSIDLLNTTVSEFKSRTPADIEIVTINETDYTVFAAETETRQVALYFYETLTDELRGIHKIGYLNPYTLAAIKTDNEGNLLVLGTTYVSGRFQRIFLNKIPVKELGDIISQ